MIYPKDLEEIDDADLNNELLHRDRMRRQGICPYCNAPLEEHKCRMKERETAIALAKRGK